MINCNIWKCQYLCGKTKLRLLGVLVFPGFDIVEKFGVVVEGLVLEEFFTHDKIIHETGMSKVICMTLPRKLRLFVHMARFPASDPVSRVISLEIIPGYGESLPRFGNKKISRIAFLWQRTSGLGLMPRFDHSVLVNPPLLYW